MIEIFFHDLHILFVFIMFDNKICCLNPIHVLVKGMHVK